MDEIKILFTHDLHDRIDSFDILEDGEIKNIAGFKRLKRAIDQERDGNTILVDGGDFSMGTLYQTIFTSDCPSLALMARMGYDATCLGNHEFELGSKALVKALTSPKLEGEPLPKILTANLDLEDTRSIEDYDFIRSGLEKAGLREDMIIEKNGLKIGVFGIIGYEAIKFSPLANMNFKDPIDTARARVKSLRERGADFIVCLSHSGTKEGKKRSEDLVLARKIDGIDFIVSGHSHRELDQALKVNNSYIGSAGRYGENLGIASFIREGDSWILRDYGLKKIVGEEDQSGDLDGQIDYYRKKIQDDYLDKFGLGYDQVLGQADFNFTASSEFGHCHKEDILANFITDSYIESLKELEGQDYEEIAVALIPVGEVRDSLLKGSIRVDQVFNVASLGRGLDGLSGYPLISSYLYGRDLKKVVELDASLATGFKVAQLHFSGIVYSFNPNRMIFNRCLDLSFEDGTPIEDRKLYRVISSLYTGQMLAMVNKMTLGVLNIVPRDREGRPIDQLTEAIVHKDGMELKQWYALASYIESLREIPLSYAEEDGRKLRLEEADLWSRLKNPNSFAKLIYGLVILLVFIVLAILS